MAGIQEKPGARKKIDCRACGNFYITWDKDMPYGCKAHAFKSARIPSVVVFQSSGMDCLLYSPKKKP